MDDAAADGCRLSVLSATLVMMYLLSFLGAIVLRWPEAIHTVRRGMDRGIPIPFPPQVRCQLSHSNHSSLSSTAQ